MAQDSIADILFRSGQINHTQLEQALAEQRLRGGDLGKHLLRLGFVTEETLLRALSVQVNMPAVALQPESINVNTLFQLPKQFCIRNRVVCFHLDNHRIHIAMAYPNQAVADEARIISGCSVSAFLATSSTIDAAIARMSRSEQPGASHIDLSPSSPMRVDPHSRNIKDAAAKQPPPQVPAARPAPRPAPAAAAKPSPLPRYGRNGFVAPQLPPLNTAAQTASNQSSIADSLFHITLDSLPAIEQQNPEPASAEIALADRVVRLEQMLSRYGRLIEWLMLALIQSGSLSQADADQILSRLDG